MTTRLLIVLLVIDGLLLVTIVRYARAGRLALRYALAALMVAVLLTILIAVPSLLDRIASAVGVQSWLAALVGAFILAGVWLFLRLAVELSRISDQNVLLAQEIAMLRAHVMIDTRGGGAADAAAGLNDQETTGLLAHDSPTSNEHA